ncbi:hypothetical protein BvCmsSIP040_05366 [Escherichia coli]|nr:hypothetical protein BvCmsKKP002_03008 [Escherichia coli]GDU63713.1 hypothetical protein BvCmsSIP042_01600 [Escherichia coli]GDW95939.1 hypothetical protein BvCmsSIP040_05366 [Escherichia coli]
MQLRLPGIAVQRFARVFSAGEINSNCRKIRLIKNSGATIKQRRPVFMLLECIQHCSTDISMFHRFITILSCCFNA